MPFLAAIPAAIGAAAGAVGSGLAAAGTAAAGAAGAVGSGLAAAGSAAVVTSDTVKNAPDVSSIVAGLPHEWQLALGAIATLASLAWGWWQKKRQQKEMAVALNTLPLVEERHIP